MIEHECRPASSEDVAYIAANMRSADIAEVQAATGREPEEALLDGLVASRCPLTFAPQGIPAAIFGVCQDPRNTYIGAPWLLATDEFPKHLRQIATFGPALLCALSWDFDYLQNYVDARNTIHIAWIKRLGFNLTRTVPEFGAEKRPFIHFERFTNV